MEGFKTIIHLNDLHRDRETDISRKHEKTLPTKHKIAMHKFGTKADQDQICIDITTNFCVQNTLQRATISLTGTSPFHISFF